jgi:hypothetical protein
MKDHNSYHKAPNSFVAAKLYIFIPDFANGMVVVLPSSSSDTRVQ